MTASHDEGKVYEGGLEEGLATAYSAQKLPSVREEPSIMALVSQLAQKPTLETVEVIERLLAMKERQDTIQAKKFFISALTSLQGEAPVIEKTGIIKDRQGNTRSRFALIDDIEDIYGPLMQKYGFAMTVSVAGIKDGMREFVGMLMHNEGHEKPLSVFLPLDKNDSRSAVQSEGSTMSYAKRMLYIAHFNIKMKGVDDDGTGAGLEVINEQQYFDLESLLSEVKGNRDIFLKLYDIPDLKQLSQRYLPAAIATLEQKRKSQK